MLTDDGVIGILIAHLGALGSDGLKSQMATKHEELLSMQRDKGLFVSSTFNTYIILCHIT